jgi:hypothetical protein
LQGLGILYAYEDDRVDEAITHRRLKRILADWSLTLSAPCSSILSASPKRTLYTSRRFTRTATFLRSRWRGPAFSGPLHEEWLRLFSASHRALRRYVRIVAFCLES